MIIIIKWITSSNVIDQLQEIRSHNRYQAGQDG